MDAKAVLKKNTEMVQRKIEGEIILIPLFKSSQDLSSIYTLNETAGAAWELIDGKRTSAEIKKKLYDRFGVSEAKLDQQLSELIKDLHAIKALKK